MTLNKLASLISAREGKKHQASIGDIREILKIMVTLEIEARDKVYANEYLDASPSMTIDRHCAQLLAKRKPKKAKRVRK